MKLVQSILTKNPCYTAGRKITVKGLMLHSVGCPQPKASVFINSWNSPSYGNACVHGFIDGNDGTVYQTLPWNHRGWHCGSGSKGSGNNTHIGVEMCEPACIKYTSGSNFTCSDTATAKAVAKRTYEAAVELFAMLCKQYSLNPTADGVIISHKEGHSRGIASNHGDPEHLWTQLGMGYTMDGFRKAVKAAMSGTSGNTSGYTKIMGTAVATAEQMKAYLKGKNPSVAQSVLDMIPLYLSEGKTEGVRGDIAFAQSCLETGNFTFSGSAVTLDQNNFCGMGVTSNGLKGNSFDTPQLGIRAQIQHLKAYASTESLKNPCIAVPICHERMRGICGVAGTARKSGRERLGCGSWVRGENPLHPKSCYRHLRRDILICGSLVPGAKDLGRRGFTEGSLPQPGQCEAVRR